MAFKKMLGGEWSMKRYVQIIDELLKQPGDTITIYKRPHIWINRI